MQLLSNAGEQREEWRGLYTVTLSSYCLMAGEQREEWSVRYNMTLYSYCLRQENRERSEEEDIM